MMNGDYNFERNQHIATLAHTLGNLVQAEASLGDYSLRYGGRKIETFADALKITSLLNKIHITRSALPFFQRRAVSLGLAEQTERMIEYAYAQLIELKND